MTTQVDILNFARMVNPFSQKELLDYFQSSGIDFKRHTVETQLMRLIKSKLLERIERGRYMLSNNHKRKFNPTINNEFNTITDIIKDSYPFLEICIWSLEDIKRISHYASNRDVIYVEVDREAIDGVFNLLSESYPARRIFVNPTEIEYTYYINGIPSIVIKPLRTEAPCSKDSSDILHPAIEKIMVDVIADADFTPWHNYEAERLYETIFEMYDVSTAKLMRYARRRTRTKQVGQILTNIKIS